jgi:hypothetical protein
MRTLAITMVFVVLNGAGFVYRTLSRRSDAATAKVAPTTAVSTSASLPGSAAPAAPATRAEPSPPPMPLEGPPPALEVVSPAQLTVAPSAAQTVKPVRKASVVIRQPVARKAQPEPQAAAVAPVVVPTTTPPPAAKAERPRSEDVLLKMEANPYKRGE